MPGTVYEPGLKKALGVYYTPACVVDYIVEHTLGKLCDGADPEQVSTIRILDPACGTGCFLVGAYQYLLNWHRNWYLEHGPLKHPAKICRESSGQWQLTRVEKKRILLNHLYGVDIDRQAVEAAKQALWLIGSEGEWSPRKSKGQQVALALGHNIKCGNALPGPSLDGGPALARRIGSINWADEFPHIMKHGGFDIVLGNPPYGAMLGETERSRLAGTFQLGTTDTAALFMVLARRLTRPHGWNGLIVPKAFTFSSSWQSLRALFLEELSTLVDVGKAWQEVKLEQVIYCLQKGRRSSAYESWKKSERGFVYLAGIPKRVCREFGFLLNGVDAKELALGRKIRQVGSFLGDFTTNARGGMLQGAESPRPGGRRVIGGKQVQRCTLQGEKGYVASNKVLPSQAYVKPGNLLVQNIVAHIANPCEHIKIIATVVEEEEASEIVILDTVNQLSNLSALSSHYLLGLLHSRLSNWYVYRFILAKAIRTMHFDGPVSGRIPVRGLDLTKVREASLHDRLVARVRAMARLCKQRAATISDQQRIQRRIATAERQIDQLVYALYGLTAEEIALIEKTACNHP